MVHALEEILRLLKPDGCLIDIHPVRKAPLIQIRLESAILFAEPGPLYDFEDLRHADEALDEVIQRGSFIVEGTGEFELVTYASSVNEMRDYWARSGAYDDSPKDATVVAQEDKIYAKAAEIMRNAPGAEIRHGERVRVTRLNPIL